MKRETEKTRAEKTCPYVVVKANGGLDRKMTECGVYCGESDRTMRERGRGDDGVESKREERDWRNVE